MELSEEYWGRKNVSAPLIKHVEKGNLILRSKAKAKWAWIHLNITAVSDGAHPVKYSVAVSGNPQLYASPDLSYLAHQSKVIEEKVWEWDQYEGGLLDLASEYSKDYHAVTSNEAAVTAWEIFITNYDAWIAHFVPIRVQELIYRTVSDDVNPEDRSAAVKMVEDYLREKFEKVFVCWKNIKSGVEQKSYADWFAKVVNGMAA